MLLERVCDDCGDPGAIYDHGYIDRDGEEVEFWLCSDCENFYLGQAGNQIGAY